MGILLYRSRLREPLTGKIANPVRPRKILYRLRATALLAAVIAGCVGLSAAQGDVPPIALQRRETTSQKKDSGPRALGLLQMNASGKPTLVPITILINGKFYDATAYKASPVPMALESGTVYEGERSGKSIGLFTVNGALRSRTPNVPTPWLGSGSWLPTGTEAPKSTRKAENTPLGIEGVDDGPPRLSKPPAATGNAPSSGGAPPSAPSAPQSGSTPSTAPSSTGPSLNAPSSAPQPGSGSSSTQPAGTPPASTTPAPQSGSGTTSTPSSSAPAPNAPPSGSSPSGSNQPGPTQPATNPTPPAQAPTGTNSPTQNPGSTPAQKTPSTQQTPPPAPSDSGASENGRPLLRRGKPNEPLPEDDIPGYGKVNAAGVVAKEKDTKTPSTPLTPTELVPAISDAAGPQPRSFVYDWEHGEEHDESKQMLGLASDALNAYLNARAKSSITVKPSSSQTGVKKPAPKAKEPVFENVKLRTFDLWGNNQPVMVLSADAHFPTSAGAASSESTTYSVTIAARTDMYKNIHQLYAGITDKYHLDVTPRLELIDAVDADGDGRGELLFHETSDIGSGYVIYRATADSLWKMFDSFKTD